MKRKTLLTSILAIVMSLSMIAGATFALFTSESQVNISVTSGTVNVEATIGELTLSSTVDGVTTNGVNGKWTNGGTATVTGNTVTLDKMTPGDTVSFDITVTNHSDVTVKARTLYAATGELASGLTINGFGDVQTTGVTLWKTLDVGSQAEVYPITIALDENVGNEYQGKTATIAFTVEAVQGNAQVEDPFTVSYNGTEEKFVSFNAALECYEAANANDVTIDIAKGTYYNTNVVLEQLADKNLTIRADKDATFANNTNANPVFLIDGNSRNDGAETLTIDGLNFELNGSAYGIKFGSGEALRYAHNVTIKNCSFVGTDNTGFGLQAGNHSSSYTVNVTDCTAEGIDTVVSIYSSKLTVSNCTAQNINGFVNNQTEAGAITSVENCNATVNGNKAEYVVRVNGGNLDVTNSTLTLTSKVAYATGAIVVRRHATNVNLAVNNTITATVADGVNGVATTVCEESKGLATVTIDKAYSVSYNYKSADNPILMQEYSATGEKTKEYCLIINANSLQNLNAWMEKNKASFPVLTIELMNSIDMTGKVMKPVQLGDNQTLTFNGNNNKISNITIGAANAHGMTGENNEVAGLFDVTANASSNLTVNNVTFENANVACDGYAAVIVGYANSATDVITLNNVDVVGATVESDTVAALVGYTIAPLTLNDCEVSGLTLTGERIDKTGAFVGTANTGSCIVTTQDCTNASSYPDWGRVIGGAKWNGVALICTTEALINAIKNAPVGETTEIFLGAKTYAGDINITVADLGQPEGDVIIKPYNDVKPTITGTVTLGYRQQGVSATMYNANITFEEITFDHAEDGKHSIYVEDIKSLTLNKCHIIGDGEWGIGAANGNATGSSKIVGCTFTNAGIQGYGNFCTGLVIDDCTFNESCINIQGGNGVTVQNCTFNSTLTEAHLGESFYLIRSNSTPITVTECAFNIDSTLDEVAAAQASWGIMWNRGTTHWTVSDVTVNMTPSAKLQTELLVTKLKTTGQIYIGDNVYVNDVLQTKTLVENN